MGKCAQDIHKKCSKAMAKDLRSDGRMCFGVGNFLDCTERDPIVPCKDKIYKDFRKVIKKVAKELMKMFKANPGLMPNC